MVPYDIARQMEAEGGRVTFARFMELALTHPREGYYRRSERLLGPRGHFSTAPRVSPVFNRAVARLLAELVDSWNAAASGRPSPPPGEPSPLPTGGSTPPSVIELGGGEGDLAEAVLESWEEARPDLRTELVYSIVEIGDGLRARQSEALSEAISAGWKVRWADDLVGAAAGTRPCVILGNEFLDALPVHLVDVQGPRSLEAWVTISRGTAEEGDVSLEEVWDDVSPEAESELQALFGTVDPEVMRPLTVDGILEVRPEVRRLMRQIEALMPVGSLLTIDYGEWNRESVGAGPAEGLSCRCDCATGEAYKRTVRGYFRHQLVVDPYERVGHQDLTADVDFRALDFHGREVGFETVLFTTVAALLGADRGEDRLSELLRQASQPASEALEADQEAHVLANLLDPEGLGGAFKVMLQVRE